MTPLRLDLTDEEQAGARAKAGELEEAEVRVIRIGISGWRYEPWRGVLYPQGLRAAPRARVRARSTSRRVEINGSFYSLQRPEYYEDWYDETPPGFVFAVKGSRYITHMLRLTKIEKPLANFFASGILALRDKMGPFLWQFPPMFRYRRERLEPFFEMLPRDTQAALRLARRRDARMIGRSRLAIDANRPLRHAVEIRHASFIERRFRLAAQEARHRTRRRRHRRQMAEAVPRHFGLRLRAPARRHQDLHERLFGPRARPAGRGASASGTATAATFTCYFDNDVKVKAPFDALNLMRKLGLSWGSPVHAPGTRVPRLKYAYGPRVTGGNPAWDDLRPSGTRKAGTRSRRSTAAYAREGERRISFGRRRSAVKR